MKTVFDNEEPLIVRLFLSGLLAVAVALSIGWSDVARAAESTPVLTGQSAFGDWHVDKPGVRRLIRPADMPRPFASPAADNIVSDAFQKWYHHVHSRWEYSINYFRLLVHGLTKLAEELPRRIQGDIRRM